MNPYYQDDAVTIYHGDCREILPGVAADVLVTDPPYGTGGWRRPQAGAGSNPKAGLVRESWDDGSVDWLALTELPVMTFWPSSRALELLQAASDTNRDKHRALYWHKPDPKPQVAGRIRWSVVVDPFMGSGSTLVAAKSLGRSAVGIEQDERWCEIAARRCSQEVLGLSA